MPRSTGSFAAIGEMHVVEFEPRATRSAASGLSRSSGSLGGVSITSNRMRTPTSPLFSSMLSRASRLAGS